jgi:hypothetical protein
MGHKLSWRVFVNGHEGTIDSFALKFDSTNPTIRDRIRKRRCLQLSYSQLREMGRTGTKPPIVDKSSRNVFDVANQFLRLKAP